MATPQTLPYIPLAYRLLLWYIEPFFALNGSYLLFFKPEVFLNTFSPYLKFQPSSQILADQLAATYILFAWNQAIVLRFAKDIRMWKVLITGMLICDLVHIGAGMKVMVDDGTVNPATWRPEDWAAVLTAAIPCSMRVAFLCNVGLGKQEDGYKKA